jgi:TPR repeat protein
MYSAGRGTLQNDIKSAEWLRRAAEQGSAPAQFALGRAYFVALIHQVQ